MRVAPIYLAGFLAAAGSLPSGLPNELPQAATAMAARAETVPARGQSGAVKIWRAEDGLFYVNAGITSGQIRLLVDTGASHIVLSHADAARIAGRPWPGATTSIRTAGGRVPVKWIVIDRIEIQGHILRDVQAAVPESDIGLSLLGQNALSQFSRLQINGDELLIQR